MKLNRIISSVSALTLLASMMVSFTVSTQAVDSFDSEIKATYSLTFDGYTTDGTTTKSYFPTFDVWVEFPFELEKYTTIEPDYEETFEYVYQGKMIQTMGCDIDLGNGYATFIPTGKTVANTAEVPKCKVSKNTNTSKIQVTADSGSDDYSTYYSGSSKVKLATIAYRTTNPKATNKVTLTTGNATIASFDTTTGAMIPDIVAMSSGKIKLGDALRIPSYEEWSESNTISITDIPSDINNVTINKKGTAYGYFKVTDSYGNKLKNKRVSYSIDGGYTQTEITDSYGYLCIQIPNITESHNYSIAISGNGVKSSVESLNVTVNPLHFTSTYEGIVTKGVSIGLGIGVEGSIGNLGAEAKLADVGLKGSNKKTLSLSTEEKDEKTKLTVTAKENSDIAVNAKLGLWAGAKKENGIGKFSAEIKAGDVHGNAKYGNYISVGFEDDDFKITDSSDVTRLAQFLTLTFLENMDSNAAIRWLIEKIPYENDTYENGSSATVSAGASIGSVTLKKGDEELAGATLGGIDMDAIWSQSTKLSKDNSITHKSSISADSGCTLLEINPYKKEGKDQTGGKTSVFQKKFFNNKTEFSAVKDKDGDLKSLSITTTDDHNNDIFMFKNSTSDKMTLKYSDDIAKQVAASYSELDSFSKGDKGFFSVFQMNRAADSMYNSNRRGDFSSSISKSKGIDLNASASVQLFLKLGGELGISGIESYSYETENGIYNNNILYTQAKNDIDAEVEDNFFGINDIFSRVSSYMSNLISQYWNTVTGWIGGAAGKVVDAGKAVVRGVGNTVRKWKVNITKATENIHPFSILAVDSEIALFSTSSVATTVGNPYIISIEDEDGNEVKDMSENPFLLEMQYTDDDLMQAGILDSSELAIFRWDEDKCVYVCMGGTLNEETMSLSLEITKPGQYILAADNCPPAVTEFTALNCGSSAEISACVSDMSGIADFNMKLDDKTVVDINNLSNYYDYTTGKFSYTADNLSPGNHSAVIYATDTSGNELTDGIQIEFSTFENLPTITNVTELPQYIPGSTDVSASVTGDDISAVYLNVEELDTTGQTRRFSYEMTGQNGVYTAKISNPSNGAILNIWVSAYSSDGNGIKSDMQTVGVTSLFITQASSESVTVKTVNYDGTDGEKVILGVYTSNGQLKNVLIKDFNSEVTFAGADFTGNIRVMLWNKQMKPLCKATDITVVSNETE